MAAACAADRVTAPNAPTLQLNASQLKAASDAQLDGTLLVPTIALGRQDVLGAAIVRSALIGNNGGTIELNDAGLKLTIPAGAITGAPILITVTALPGTMVAYEFLPHGTVFAKALKFDQSLENTTWDDYNFKGVLAGGYFRSEGQLNLTGGTALLNETYPVTVSKKHVTFDIWHFSGYMVATGRMSATTAPSEF